MATYTVIQDIEAEDKLLGPLSLRQFIYSIIVVILCYVMFKLALVQPLIAVPILPIAVLFAVLAAPFGHDQSSEIWLLAKIRFFLKPRLRIWNQGGLQELVKITAPPRVEHVYTDGLNQTQVKSRLQALAQTIDTRGWVVKGVDVNLYNNPTFGNNQDTDRLVSSSSLTPATAVPEFDVHDSDDILDVSHNAMAQQMDQMVHANDQFHRQAILNKMDRIRTKQQAQTPTSAFSKVIQPTSQTRPLPVLQPSTLPAVQRPPFKPQQIAPVTVTAPHSPAILGLASNDDLSVATIARQANKATNLGDDEVVISLR